MRENVIKTVLLIINVCVWVSGWAVLAVGVRLMSEEHGRHYAVILLGPRLQLLTTPPPLPTPSSRSKTDDDNVPIYEDENDKELIEDSFYFSQNAIPLTQDSMKPSSNSILPANRTSSSSSISSSSISSSSGSSSSSSKDSDTVINTDLHLEVALLVMGSVVVIAGLVGCIASSQNDKTLLLAYCCLILTIGIGNGGAGIWCVSNAPQNLDDISLLSSGSSGSSSKSSNDYSSSSPLSSPSDPPPLQRLQRWYGSSKHPTYTSALDRVQEELSCCGLTGPGDFTQSYWHRVYSPGKNILPPSCCQSHTKSQPTTPTVIENVQCEDASKEVPNQPGCIPLLAEWVRSDYVTTGVTLMAISVLQIAGATTTLLLRKQIKTMTCAELPPVSTLLF